MNEIAASKFGSLFEHTYMYIDSNITFRKNTFL